MIAFRDGKLLLIQCKSYTKQKFETEMYKIASQAKSWHEIAEHISRNVEHLIERLRKRDPRLYNEMKERGIELIYPLLITEVDSFEVSRGCRVINIPKFLIEILHIQTRNLWHHLVDNKEAILVEN